MAYDYDAILQSITKKRLAAYRECSISPSYPSSTDTPISNVDIEPLSQAVEDYATLSSHCPLPPLLWLQYACDAGILMECLLSSGNDEENIEQENEEVKKNRQQISETRMGILSAGIQEFPGCKLLRRLYLEEMLRDHYNNSISTNENDQNQAETNIFNKFTEAVQWVCEGSYYNETEEDLSDILQIWKMFISFVKKSTTLSHEKIKEIFIQRSSIPVRRINDEILDEISKIPDITNDADFLGQIELKRREASKLDQIIGPLEDEVSEAMEQDGINVSLTTNDNEKLWVFGNHIFLRTQPISKSDTNMTQQSYLMGLGSMVTAKAFIKYARSISKNFSSINPIHAKSQSESIQQTHKGLILAIRIYERAVAECPTVEELWITYIHFLLYLIQHHSSLLSMDILLDACHRSVRNCPYSLTLHKLQMHCNTLDIKTEIELDRLIDIAKSAVEAKFLPSADAYLDLYMEVPRVIRRRLLKVLSYPVPLEGVDVHIVPFDASDTDESKPEKLPVMSEEDKNELILDLIDDVREAYDSADLFVRKNYHNWNAGRGKLWRERATVESKIFYPIYKCYPVLLKERAESVNKRRKKTVEEMAFEGDIEEEAVKCFEKVIRIHPKCVNAWKEYISFMAAIGRVDGGVNNGSVDCEFVVGNIRRVRGLYRRAIKFAGAIHPTEAQTFDDFGSENVEKLLPSNFGSSSSISLFHDFVTFETNFGSMSSLRDAFSLIRSKLKKLSASPIGKQNSNDIEDGVQHEIGNSRLLDENNSIIENNIGQQKEDSKCKKRKIEKISQQNSDSVEKVQKPINLKVEKKAKDFIVIGDLKYPAHPYTIHVSNLSTETEDMDLVNLFKQCGPIVHARIFRVKNNIPKEKAKSKGRGLVQFEDSDSVTKALELSENVGLHERLIKIERSNCPAVAIVPSGMWKLNPKGEGKKSRINMLRKEKKLQQKIDAQKNQKLSRNIVTKSTKASASNKNMKSQLIFKPSVLIKKSFQKKKKIDL